MYYNNIFLSLYQGVSYIYLIISVQNISHPLHVFIRNLARSNFSLAPEYIACNIIIVSLFKRFFCMIGFDSKL